MTTKQIIEQMDKGFDEKFKSKEGKETAYAQGWLLLPDDTKAFIRSYTRTLLESFGEEMIKEGERVVDGGAYGDEYCENENCHFGLGYKVARDCTDKQRLKVKEIISSIGK